MAVKLGAQCRRARIEAGLRTIELAHAAQVSEATISRFEQGVGGWKWATDEIVAAYERECELPSGELWRRAAGC